MDYNNLNSYLPGRSRAPVQYGCLVLVTAAAILIATFVVRRSLSGGTIFWIAQIINVAALVLLCLLLAGGVVYAIGLLRLSGTRILRNCIATARCFARTRQSTERALTSLFFATVTIVICYLFWQQWKSDIWGVVPLLAFGTTDWFTKALHAPSILVLTTSSTENFALVAKVRHPFMVRTVALLEPSASEALVLTRHGYRASTRRGVTAIVHLIHDYRGLAEGTEIDFQPEVRFERLAPVLENAIYRMVQDGLTNA